MGYDHTQTGWLHHLVFLVAALLAVGAWWFHDLAPPLAWTWGITAAALVPLALMFQRLTVRDEGFWLRVRFGPVPLFGTRIPYAEMTDVQPDRSGILDGLGVHYMPGKGWIYNVRGRDCVRVQMGQKSVRIGTDDREGLVAFLRSKMAQPERR